MNKSHSNKSSYFLFGCAAFMAMLIMSMYFWRERVMFLDTALKAFMMIMTERPSLFAFRYGAFVPQIIPLTAIWTGGSLQTILVWHSASFVILFFGIFLVAYLYSGKNSVMFLLVPLYLLMLTNEEFYWPQSEYQQGMVWLCLYAVLMFGERFRKLSKGWRYAAHALFVLWIQSFHPLIFIPVFFLLCWYYFNSANHQRFSREYLLHTGFAFIAFIARYILGKYDWYEADKLNVADAIKQNLPHLFSLGSVHEFFSKLPFEYAGYVIVLIAALTALVLQRKYRLAVLTVSVTAFYWLLVVLTNPNEGRFYSEYLLLPIGFVAALAFITEVLERFNTKWMLALAGIFMIARLGIIYHSHTDYSNRLTMFEPYINYARENAFGVAYVDAKLLDKEKYMMNWGTAYESMLMTSLGSPDSCIIVQIEDDLQPFKNDSTAGPLPVVIAKEFNDTIPSRYFHFSPNRCFIEN